MFDVELVGERSMRAEAETPATLGPSQLGNLTRVRAQ